MSRKVFFIAGKLRPLPRDRVVAILLSNGFIQVRASKHITFKKADNEKVMTTWVPHHDEVSLFVIKHIIRQTRKPREEFE